MPSVEPWSTPPGGESSRAPSGCSTSGMTAAIRLVIQARLSSTRFPGKVLAPVNGRAIIAHVVARIATTFPISNVIVATSALESDDPLAAYGEKLGVAVFRGPLDDVFTRFQLCLRAYPCDWAFRVSADSPLFDPGLIPLLSAFADRADIDLVTNVFPRTFPRGHSLEMIRSSTLLGIDASGLTPYQREHVTPVFYDNPNTYRIVNLESGDPLKARINLCVDTVEDLQRVEELARETTSC